jgi:hypothetical protein
LNLGEDLLAEGERVGRFNERRKVNHQPHNLARGSKIVIEGYLTQQKLAIALVQFFADDWLGHELKHPKSRRRWDMSIRTQTGIHVIEYDGDEHYCNSLKVKADREKDRLALEMGWKVIRIPYWVQLDSETFSFYFASKAIIEQNFPHGFITTKTFPASFCELGVLRFQHELSCLPERVRQDVIRSLSERAAKHGVEYVLPSQLLHVIPMV